MEGGDEKCMHVLSRNLGGGGLSSKDSIKMDLIEAGCECVTRVYLMQGAICKYYYELSGSTKCGEFIDQMSNCQLPKN
jgi:hypothetical protein